MNRGMAKIGAMVRGAVLTVIVVAVAAACTGAAQRDESAANLIPALPDYEVINTLDVQDAIAKVAGGTTLLAGQPQIAAMVVVANEITKCYQNVGAIEARVFVRRSNPLHAGALIVINRNKLTDPQTFLGCVLPNTGSGPRVAVQLQPCTKAYTLQKDNNEFYIAYVATDESVCTELCSKMEGCTAG